MSSAAIITAAGASTRIGQHKALLEWRGRTLVAHQVQCLVDAGFDPVIVVTGSEAEHVEAATPDSALIVHNKVWQTGRSSSIEAGAAAVLDDTDAILVVAVDQPLLPGVLDVLRSHLGAPLVQPVDAEGRPGHPVVLGSDALEDLRSIRGFPEGLRNVVQMRREDAVFVEVVDLPHWDLNTLESYRRAREIDASTFLNPADH